ncbi:hypothetical protein Taro_029768 [Colocasia esculenta]|uniref:CCHC-type domain-containing protein n=1 Tax=Colocasia esculenta TaxID=4460 RepID=A0A843VM83_COLES|nr:hypothetical protein [Colocasia esculenta]
MNYYFQHNYLCCALSKREFSRISACKSAKEIWDKLQVTYEGTDKVKQTRLDILQFKMLPNENITQISKIAGFEDSDVDEVLSKLQKILKKKKNGSRRIQRKEKKEKEPVFYECRKPGHLRPDCLRLKKTGQTEKPKKQHKKFKRKVMAAAWENDEATSSVSSSSDSEKEQIYADKNLEDLTKNMSKVKSNKI